MSELQDFLLEQRIESERKIIAKAWEDEAFKAELLSNPREVLSRELNIEIPDDIEVQVMEEGEQSVYFVLPRKLPEEMANMSLDVDEELSDEALEAVSGGGVEIGVTAIKSVGKGAFTSVMWGQDALRNRGGMFRNPGMPGM